LEVKTNDTMLWMLTSLEKRNI